MAYVSLRDRLVLFGGAPRESSETGEFDGAQWALAATAGPSPRSRAGLAYDAARAVTVLFGGRDPSGLALGDTWEWDGVAWTQVADSGPRTRSRHVLVFDSDLDRCVTFSGTTGPYLRDTWAWNGATWDLVAEIGPPPRVYYGMAYDSARGVTTLFGGWDGQAPLEDTWELRCDAGCFADCDADQSLTLFDFLCFQNRFGAGDLRADCDGSGALDLFDFLCFQNLFSRGCG
jgi:hypothetical protein